MPKYRHIAKVWGQPSIKKQSQFSQDAKGYVKRLGDKKIILIDGEQLAELMIDFNVATVTHETYEVKRLDLDFFDDEWKTIANDGRKQSQFHFLKIV